MNQLELKFFETVPRILRGIEAELKRQNDLREKELELAAGAIRSREANPAA